MMLRPNQVNELLRLAARNQRLSASGIHSSAVLASGHVFPWHGPERQAAREVVGHGHNGEAEYTDRLDFWYPATRFQKSTPEMVALQTKEKGDWKALTHEERKKLYRHSFRQTYAELMAPNGHWKPTIALTLYLFGLVCMFHWWVHRYMTPFAPPTYTPQYKEYMLAKCIDMHSEPMDGIASEWDYEKNTWKK